MKLNKKFFPLAACVLVFSLANIAYAVTTNSAVTLSIPADGGSSTVTIESGSTFDSISYDGSVLTITLAIGQSTTLGSSAGKTFVNDQSVSTLCSSDGTSSISLDRERTYTVSLGATCTVPGGGGAGGAGGGGGGGGGGGAVSPSATPSPTPTTTPLATTPTPTPVSVGDTVIIPTPIPQLTGVPNYLAIPTKELARGLKNDEDVLKLQMLLATDPSIYPEGLITGNFGPATFAAVKRFQEKYGLPAVGRVGPMTLAKLAEVFGGGGMVQEPSTTPPPAPSGGKLTRELQLGDEGDDVLQLQAYLAGDPELYPEGKLTGYFGPLTRAAVKRFQAKYGIAQVGRVGPVTLAKLNELMQ